MADQKSFVHNLIIVDRSGSMCSIRSQAVGGLNETLATIRVLQEKTPERQQLVSVLFFCGCTMKFAFKNAPIQKVKAFKNSDYEPCCSTPLYDAIGISCTELEQFVGDSPQDSVSVTIITDGYENASREFSGKAVADIINRLKERGWLFAYIGADHDVEAVAYSLKIDNAMAFEKSDAGTKNMFSKLCACRASWQHDEDFFYEECCDAATPMSAEEMYSRKAKNSKDFFKRSKSK